MVLGTIAHTVPELYFACQQFAKCVLNSGIMQVLERGVTYINVRLLVTQTNVYYTDNCRNVWS